MVETKSPANPLFLRDEELRQGIELMFYAYRDFTFESDQQLKRYHLGRAHHRALYFIGRQDDMSWLDERAFRSCLGVKVPMETIRDPSFERGVVSLQIELEPSGRISGVWIVSGSGNAELDEYLRRRLTTMRCGRISTLESREAYSIILDITIEVER